MFLDLSGRIRDPLPLTLLSQGPRATGLVFNVKGSRGIQGFSLCLHHFIPLNPKLYLPRPLQ